MIHIDAPVHARAIIRKALLLVLLLRYLRGDVMDQYLSKDNMNKLNMEAVEAV